LLGIAKFSGCQSLLKTSYQFSVLQFD